MESRSEEKGEPKLDRLSDLHGDLIRKILSSMTYRESVGLRFISKRLSSVWLSWLWDVRRNSTDASLKRVVDYPYRFLGELQFSHTVFSPCQAVFIDCPLLRELSLVCCREVPLIILNSVRVDNISLINCRGLKTVRLPHDHQSHNLRMLSYLPHLRDQDNPLRIEFNSLSPHVLQIVSSCRATQATESFFLDTHNLLASKQYTRFFFDKTHRHVFIKSLNDITSFYFIPGIKSFSFGGCVNQQIYPTVDLVHRFTTLKSLNLYNLVTTSRMIEENMISNRFLKDVRLKDCRVRLSSEPLSVTRRCYLKKAKLSSMKFLDEDGTEYGGYSKLQKKLRDFLYLFGHCKTLKLSLEKERMYMYPKKLRRILKPPLCEVKNLKLEKHSFLNTSLVNLVDNFLWLAPRLNTLSFHVCHIHVVTIKFCYATQPEGVSDQTICHLNAPQEVTGARHEMTEIVVEINKYYRFKEKLRNYFVRNVKAKIIKIIIVDPGAEPPYA